MGSRGTKASRFTRASRGTKSSKVRYVVEEPRPLSVGEKMGFIDATAIGQMSSDMEDMMLGSYSMKAGTLALAGRH